MKLSSQDVGCDFVVAMTKFAIQCDCTSLQAGGEAAFLIGKHPESNYLKDRRVPSEPGTIQGFEDVIFMFSQLGPGPPGPGDTEGMRMRWFAKCLDGVRNLGGATVSAMGERRKLVELASEFGPALGCVNDARHADKLDYSVGMEAIAELWKDELKSGGWWPFFEQAIENETLAEASKGPKKDRAAGLNTFPPAEEAFSAFLATPLEEIKVVLIGQDPYHTSGAANGLAFSCPANRKKPQPSLQNVLKELESDGFVAKSGDLTPWARNGVFLINTSLTVREGKATSHSSGWDYFSRQLFRHISETLDRVVVLAWGAHAQGYSGLFDKEKHKVLQTSHPSPFSAHRGFLGSKPFSSANEILKGWGKEPIDWNLGA